MVPPLSALSLAVCYEALEGGGNHKMETSIAKRNFCSHQYLVTDILNAHITKGFEKTYRIINLKGVGGWGITSLLHFIPLHRDLGKGWGSLHCFTPFRFIAIWGRGGDHSIASLCSASSRFGGRGGDRSIASLCSASSRFGGWVGDRSIASLRSASSRFGEGVGIAPLLHSILLHHDLGVG